jgi:hypothetical protein
MKEGEGFTISKALQDRINEQSYGGFLLFAFDDKGTPRSYAQFDNELNMMALQKTAEYWLEGLHRANVDNLRGQMGLPTDHEEGDDEEVEPDADDEEDEFFS